jgi:hypothetical protein
MALQDVLLAVQAVDAVPSQKVGAVNRACTDSNASGRILVQTIIRTGYVILQRSLYRWSRARFLSYVRPG